MFANTMSWGSGAGAAEAARAAEENGFESIWTVEHVVYPDDYQSAYPYSPDGKMPAVPSRRTFSMRPASNVRRLSVSHSSL